MSEQLASGHEGAIWWDCSSTLIYRVVRARSPRVGNEATDNQQAVKLIAGIPWGREPITRGHAHKLRSILRRAIGLSAAKGLATGSRAAGGTVASVTLGGGRRAQSYSGAVEPAV